MIPAAFDYLSPSTVDEVLTLLEEHGEDAKVLAGGHSLLPLMKLRLSTPAMLVDLRRIDELRGIRSEPQAITVGSMVRYVELEDSGDIRSHLPMLAQAVSLVGDAQVRNRGTIGGAVAHADPAGDLPAVVCALDAEIDIRSPSGLRSVNAETFFRDMFETVVGPDELVVAIRFPIASSQPKQYYEKFRRRLADWAIVAAAVNLELEDGRIRSSRVALTNVGRTPRRAVATESALLGREPSPENITEAAGLAADGLDPTPELNASADYKRHLARVIARRAIENAIGSGSAPAFHGSAAS